MDSRIEKHLRIYKEYLEKLEKGEVAEVKSFGLSVEWNEPRNGGQSEDFGDDLSAAISFIKAKTDEIFGERYADKEHFPSLNFRYMVKMNSGQSMYTFDTIIESYEARRGNFDV